MAKQTKESIMGELDGRHIGYSDGMTLKELNGLLKDAQDKQAEAEKPKPPDPIDVSQAKCGLATIQDHERRIILIERAIENLIPSVPPQL